MLTCILVFPLILRFSAASSQLVDRDDIGKWPRALIIVPTRELCAQVENLKMLVFGSYHVFVMLYLSCCCLHGLQ